MASLIPGYEYDIFVSYRQKDNKYDGWVTEFVDNLKNELEATFKEEISLYFDINPHDGLLETHDVGASLEGKLKSLILIPVISRTYCDPKSFAWVHELKAFTDLARKDPFGLKVKLPGGNVASRVLPVRIHDLDNDDLKLCELVLGGALRGIEFVYKEPGVNKPLTAEDDDRKNLNNTKYRIQINKTANAIKEIIAGLRGGGGQVNTEVKSSEGRTLMREKSIIVLPFENISPDPDQEYFSDGLTEEIITDLSYIDDLFVISRSSAMTFKGAKITIQEIADRVHVKYVLEGSVRKAGNNLRITAQLIDGVTDTHIWAGKYDGTLDDIFDIQEKVARSIAESLKLKISSEEKESISKNLTRNLEAYNYYLKGRFFYHNGTKEDQLKSMECFNKALSEDPDYALAYSGLAESYYAQGAFGWLPLQEAISKAKEYLMKALYYDKNLAEAHAALGVIYGAYDWKYNEAIAELSLALSLNSKCLGANQYYAGLMDSLGRNEEARVYINRALELDPTFFYLYLLSAQLYYNEGRFEESMRDCRKALENNPHFHEGYWRAIRIYFRLGDEVNAAGVIKNYLNRDTLKAKYLIDFNDISTGSGFNSLLNLLIKMELDKSNPDPYFLAVWYILSGNKDKALDFLEKAVGTRYVAIPMINNDPDFDVIRQAPRFQELIEKLGLTENQI
jgi:TolB-like protein/Tfp pilus assembly protein PilF